MNASDIPPMPASGQWVLSSKDGVLEWLEVEQCGAGDEQLRKAAKDAVNDFMRQPVSDFISTSTVIPDDWGCGPQGVTSS